MNQSFDTLQNWFVATNAFCDAESLTVASDTELQAKQEILEKLGYKTVAFGNTFYMVDADDSDLVETVLRATTFEQAVSEAITRTSWHVTGPFLMVGRSSDTRYTRRYHSC